MKMNTSIESINIATDKEENCNYFPFNLQWLDSSYQQTCLPDSPWRKVLDDLEPALANKTYQQFDNPQRRQIILELLGPQFQRTYFRIEHDTPHILLPPSMSETARYQLEMEAKSWLQIQTLKAAVDIRAAAMDDEDANRLSMNMQNFLQYTYAIVSKSLERYLYQSEEKQVEDKIHQKKHQIELTGRAKLRSILRDAKTNSKKLPMINETITATSNSMTSNYSNILADSIIALLKRDLRRVIFIKEKLFGQQLPVGLRQLIWSECLFRLEKKSVDDDLSVVECQIRRDFAAGIVRGKNQLNINNPSNSPITNLIENDAIETYSNAQALESYLNEHHLRTTIKILNILYTYNREYKSYFIYWLLPFQLSYNDEVNKDIEIYAIAMHLHLFIRHCYPSWTQIFEMTSRIILDLSNDDPEFYYHLRTISNIRAKINSKDFISEILSAQSKQPAPNPALFLRQWISQIFVGILRSNAVLYLWDQFFMTKWNIDYLECAIKAVFYLLRARFIYAKDYDDMRKVFLEEPAHLHTSDIQTAFIQVVSRNRDSKYISTINRRVYPLKPIILNKCKVDSELIGMKNISLSLIMPIRKDPRDELRYKTLIVEIQLYEGGDMFDSISTKTVPVLRKRERSIHDWQKLTLDILHEKLILSVRKSRSAFSTTPIQALVILHQRLDVITLKTIAYCRFPLYIPRKIGNLDTWDVTSGSIERALHPGIPPFSIDIIPDTPRAFIADKIGPNSTISLVVFDPQVEQYLNPTDFSILFFIVCKMLLFLLENTSPKTISLLLPSIKSIIFAFRN